jgi:hypothetical protein
MRLERIPPDGRAAARRDYITAREQVVIVLIFLTADGATQSMSMCDG